ncbi:DUF4236 domain-containing protein [Faecalibacterium sp. An192]|uniref:DUF4236 domain-containing protein n=1 Tax=Faecalibacterium sp. An192 TaxID=1965581 RepID=UPI000B561304|nr:DUF4236 domain-containing protein [Faecalibacterium sp. An192]OUP26947.1 hypothetical protein B5F27_11960 [Faecalibacterium sp. An192]
MGFRFRKSKKVGPFRINMSQKGIGWSVGVKWLRYTKKADGGSRITASIPGTGISYVTDSKKSSRKSQPKITAPDQKLLDQVSPAAGENYNPSPVPGGAGSGGGKRPGHGCLWWVVAILFWPFSLSIWFWRSSLVSNKALKAGILAVAWVLILLAGSASDDSTSSSLPTSSSGPASSMIAASSEVQEEENLPAESTPVSEPASSQDAEVQAETDSAPASSQEPQKEAAASEPAAPAASESAPAVSSESAAAPAPVETAPAPVVTTPAPAQQQEVMVWISATGSKYHSRSSCSNMKNPSQVTLEQAQALGLTPCKKCY